MTAADVIARYGLSPHPEGGYYREVHRSARGLGVPPGYPGERVALTVILYLLARGQLSVLHRVRSEEVWAHLAGAPLELVILGETVRVLRLEGPGGPGEPVAVVPAGAAQGARSLGDWTLVSCIVAPGFEFDDFEILPRRELLARFPDAGDLVLAYTRGG